jgi:nucleoid-associated protein YgaU
MKKYLLILIVFVMASGLALAAQSLLDNPDYQKSLELNAMAVQAFDEGDYDAAAEYAVQAKEYAILSDQYVEKMLAKSKADRAIAQAQEKMAWADGIDAANLYPEPYARATEEYASSIASYDAEDYPEAEARARSTLEAVDAIAAAAADAAIAQAKDKIAWADGIDANALYPDLYAKASDAYTAAVDAYDAQDYLGSASWAQKAVEDVDAIAVADADAAISQAKDAISAAELIEAPVNYPGEYEQATAALSDALAAYDSQDYLTAAERARACVAALVGVKPKEPEPVVVAVVVPEVKKPEWPAVYVVRLIPARRDCLWRIAEYPFIYNNPLKWPVIYEANKKTFRDPANPNLIFPGQKLKIPSIKGETREGTFDPSVTYEPFPKK